jgi:hypothetical protein
MVHSGDPAEDSIVMCPEADTCVCMLDRAGLPMNDFFRFSTTKMQWEQLDAGDCGWVGGGQCETPQVSGSRPSRRHSHGMVTVGSDLYVFGGITIDGDTRRCDAGNRLAACQIERRRYSARCCGACWHML